MRVQAPQDSIVLGGRNVFSPADAEVWLAAPDSTVGKRTEDYTNRAFRDAHPLDDNYDPTTWDGNGYRILMGSLGIKAAAGNAQTLIDPARTFSTLTNAPAGGLNYTFSKYRIEVSEQPTFDAGPGSGSQPSCAGHFDRELPLHHRGLQPGELVRLPRQPLLRLRFYGRYGLPAGRPHSSRRSIRLMTTSRPAMPLTRRRLNDIALQIIQRPAQPDILMVEEVENQDICSYADGVFNCPMPYTDGADGKPDVLQELAAKIATNGGPAYDAAFDRDSSDLRGIAPAFLYRTDRVESPSPSVTPSWTAARQSQAIRQCLPILTHRTRRPSMLYIP